MSNFVLAHDLNRTVNAVTDIVFCPEALRHDKTPIFVSELNYSGIGQTR
jgi:hypothetical protein